MEEEQEVMPAGAMPPEPEPEPELEQEEEVEEAREELTQEPILGKFKSPDELATAYQELEKKIGEQGNELGSMKQMNSMLLEQMQQRQAESKVPATEEEQDDFDYEQQMSQLIKGVEEGEIPFEQAIAYSAHLASESATRNALSQYKEMTTQQQKQAAQEQFLQDNPDFIELYEAGALDDVKQSLPGMHDDFSAYFAIKAQQAAEQAQQEAETKRIAQGDERTTKVLQKPGNPTKQPGKPIKKMTPAELKAKTLADLEALG